MKTRNILTVAAFIVAIGSAFASSQLPQDAFTSKQDVPDQVADCEQRGQCDGSRVACEIILNQVSVPLYDGNSTEEQVCGAQLMRN